MVTVNKVDRCTCSFLTTHLQCSNQGPHIAGIIAISKSAREGKEPSMLVELISLTTSDGITVYGAFFPAAVDANTQKAMWR